MTLSRHRAGGTAAPARGHSAFFLFDTADNYESHYGYQNSAYYDRCKIFKKPSKHLRTLPFRQAFALSFTFWVSFSASLYFLINSIYTMNARTAAAAIKPATFIFPVNMLPNWNTIRDMA